MKSGLNKWLVFLIYLIINALLTHFLYDCDLYKLYVIVPIVLLFEFGIAYSIINKMGETLVGMGLCIFFGIIFVFVEKVFRALSSLSFYFG